MKIYTRKGDKGKTSIRGGEQLDKDDLRIESYGTIDELNSTIGHLRSLTQIHNSELSHIQSRLFSIGSDLALQDVGCSISHNDIVKLEQLIDSMSEELAPLQNFILPGGSTSAAVAHVARTVARRAERRVISFSKQTDVPQITIAFINRLSDYLFVLARYVNMKEGKDDIPWNSNPQNKPSEKTNQQDN